MSIAQLSPSSVNASPAYINPQVKAEQATTVPQVKQESQDSVKATKTDTVTISQQALQKLKKVEDAQAQDVKKSDAKKAAGSYRTVA